MSYWLNKQCFSPDGSPQIQFYTRYGYRECTHETCPLDKLSSFKGSHCFQCCYGNITANALHVTTQAIDRTYADVMMYLGPFGFIFLALIIAALVWKIHRNKAKPTVCPDTAGDLSALEMQLPANGDIPTNKNRFVRQDVGYQNDTNDDTDDLHHL